MCPKMWRASKSCCKNETARPISARRSHCSRDKAFGLEVALHDTGDCPVRVGANHEQRVWVDKVGREVDGARGRGLDRNAVGIAPGSVSADCERAGEGASGNDAARRK